MLSILYVLYVIAALGLILSVASPFIADWLGW